MMRDVYRRIDEETTPQKGDTVLECSGVGELPEPVLARIGEDDDWRARQFFPPMGFQNNFFVR